MGVENFEIENTTELVGAVAVIGAGIAGMQTALDLADSGLKIYLLEHAPAIGGTMAMLDKTFPTNDCAMCIMSPKLVEVGRHLNIELLVNSEVINLEGKPGNFTLKYRQHPRYVDLKKCTGCGDCATACPVEFPDKFNGELSKRKAIYKLYAQAIPNAYAIEKLGTAPCRDACPIHQRTQGYTALLAAGRFADAYCTILEDNPFPSICGRVCNHRCEQVCNRAQIDSAVNLMGLKRFIADWAFEHPEEISESHSKIFQNSITNPPPLSEKHVAIVGSGPAGLTCARYLSRLGCNVTIYESLPVAGGMLRVGLPAHRLPVEIVEREINAILEEERIDLRLNHQVEDVEKLLESYDAIFVAIGAHSGVKLQIPGNNLPGVLLATDFLRLVNLRSASDDLFTLYNKNIPEISGRRVLVLGGGNVAIDAAMTAVRLGAAWVGITCLESRKQMPAHDWEINEAEGEGIDILPSRTFKEVHGKNGIAAGVLTAQVDFRGFVDGRPDFDELPGKDQLIQADVIIFAIGQRPDSSSLTQVQIGRGGRIVVNPESLETSVPGIFSGGDSVTGTAFIVDAIAAGHHAARSIASYLGVTSGDNGYIANLAPFNLDQAWNNIKAGKVNSSPRIDGIVMPPSLRKNNFSEIHSGLDEAQARGEASRCLNCGVCSECNQCVNICRAGAIQHNDIEKIYAINVGAVVLATGLEAMPGDIRPEYGYGRFPNVITSLQFERMLSASGPFGGVVQRPSDGTHPKKVAWIQCVGSRDCSQGSSEIERAAYCSSVCCMYATKEAIIAREHDPNIKPAIFYLDIRSFGKGFESYIERAKDEQDIRYVRCLISSVKEVPGSHNLRLRYICYEGSSDKRPKPVEEEFELVVLSVGLKPTASSQETAKRLGIHLNEYGFVKTKFPSPVHTSRSGVFAAGACTEPKDIPESVIEASCAASQAAEMLHQARGRLTQVPIFPVERDISEEAPRVGVFVCHCGINIGGVVNTSSVVDYARLLPGVVFAEHNLYTCSQDTQARICALVKEHHLNRVVVASCTPRTHEPLFQDTMRQCGLNPHLFEMANIREHDSWVHRSSLENATDKAMQLVAMAVAKACKLNPIMRNTFQVDQKALVVGGGLAGMTAALSISRQGFKVYLVEKQINLGGNMQHIYTNLPGMKDAQEVLNKIIQDVKSDERIQVMTASEVVEFNGFAGQFRSLIRNLEGVTTEFSHGVIVVATGGQEITTSLYQYGKDPRILTQRELEKRLQNSDFLCSLSGKTIIMIQCVNSRDADHPYCSRICCTQALKNSIYIKERIPDIKIIILYRDIRSYGFREQWYRQARKAGVIFIEFDIDHLPEVAIGHDGTINLKVAYQPENKALNIAPDWLILSVGIEPNNDNVLLAQLLKVPLNETKFFLEAHVKLRPVDFSAEGIFVCGLAHSPRDMQETISQAQGAALRAANMLAKSRLEAIPITARVDPKKCAACGVCVEACPYGARLLEASMTHAEVVEVLCQGCGACVAACPNKASQQQGFELDQELAMIEAICS